MSDGHMNTDSISEWHMITDVNFVQPHLYVRMNLKSDTHTVAHEQKSCQNDTQTTASKDLLVRLPHKRCSFQGYTVHISRFLSVSM